MEHMGYTSPGLALRYQYVMADRQGASELGGWWSG
jgi:hypothetical protein